MAGPIRGVVLANELLDNLPVAVAVRRGAGWVERLVGAGPGGLCWEEGPARPEVAAWAERHAGPVPEGGLVETQIAAGAWLRGMLRRLAAGAVVVVDYGDTGAGLAPRRAEGTLRTYRHHHLGPDPLAEPGGTDITVDVDFGALAAAAEGEGAAVEVTSQAAFLERWGLRRPARPPAGRGTGPGARRRPPGAAAGAQPDHRGRGAAPPARPGRLPGAGGPPLTAGRPSARRRPVRPEEARGGPGTGPRPTRGVAVR